VIAKLEEMKKDLEKELDEQEEKIAAVLDQARLNNFVAQLRELDDPEEVKKLATKFDEDNNENKDQVIRLKILYEIKKNNLFRFRKIKGMEEMWRRFVKDEWEISSYRFES